MKLNLEKYISKLLMEMPEIKKSKEEIEKEKLEKIEITPVVIERCHNTWVADKPDLTKQNTLNIIRNFMLFVEPKLKNGFNQPEILTFCYSFLNQNPFFNNINNQDEFLNLLQIRYSTNELVMNDPGAVKRLKTALKNNEVVFNYGQEVVKDENGNVKTQTIQKGAETKEVPVMRENTYNTAKMANALQTLKDKKSKLEPFLSKLYDIQNYKLVHVKFILDEFDRKIIQMEARQIVDEDELLSRNLASSPENIQKSKEIMLSEDSKNLIWKSDNGKVRLYDVKNQAAAIRYRYYGEQIRDRLEELKNKGLLKNVERIMSFWCVTTPSTTSTFYNSYRSTYNYKFYFLINDDYNFMDLTDEQLEALPEDSPLRNFDNLKSYINMICLKQNDEKGESGSMIVDDLTNTEPRLSWGAIEKKFHGLESAKELFVYKKFDNSELISKQAQENALSQNPNDKNYLGGKSQGVKSAYIVGTPLNNGRYERGVILNGEIWKTLSLENKTNYFDTTTPDNYINKFKSESLYLEILSDAKIYGNFKFYLKTKVGDNALTEVRKKILEQNYNVNKPHRYSLKNKNIQLLEMKEQMSRFRLIDAETVKPFESDEITYDGVYIRNKMVEVLMDTANPNKMYLAEKWSRSDGYDGPDTFWTLVLPSKGDEAYIINNKVIKQLIDEGKLTPSDDDGEGIGMIDTSALQNKDNTNIHEIKKGL